MEDDVFDSIESIDAALEKELGELANSQEDVVDTNNEVEEETTNEDTPTESSSEEEKEQEQEESVETNDVSDKVNKKDYAFANLRAENGNLKKERDAYKSDSDFLKSLAQEYGYDDVNAFQNALKEQKYQKEAQSKGYDYELYKKTKEQEERIAQLERAREVELNERKIDRFKNAIEVAKTKYDVDENDIFDRLENAGVTVEEILTIGNPELLIRGVLADKIQAEAKQNQINEIKNMQGLVEDKNEGNTSTHTVTIDTLLKSDLADYKKKNYFE